MRAPWARVSVQAPSRFALHGVWIPAVHAGMTGTVWTLTADVRLGCPDGQAAMKLRRDSHLKSTGVLAVGDRGWWALAGGLHVRDDVGNQAGDAFQRRTLGLGQVGQAGKLRAEADELAVFFGPDHAIRVVFGINHIRACRLPQVLV